MNLLAPLDYALAEKQKGDTMSPSEHPPPLVLASGEPRVMTKRSAWTLFG